MSEHKNLIRRHFGAAGASYASEARMQAEAAALLTARLPDIAVARGLEIGCGTGFLTKALLARYPDAAWTITDLSPEMLEVCAGAFPSQARFEVQDGEALSLAGPFDLIASNLAFQWFENLPGAVTRLRALLATGGRLMFTTLGEGTFAEWRTLLAGYSLSAGTPDYPSITTLQEQLGADLDIQKISMRETYENPLAFLRHLRAIGAHTPRADHRPARLRAVLRAHDALFTVSYELLMVETRR